VLTTPRETLHPSAAAPLRPTSRRQADSIPVGARARDASHSRPGLHPERELAAIARARGPLRRALAAVAGRFVERRAWERLGFARLRDYAVERVGLSARTLHDLAHVDSALAHLPAIDHALAAGEITWTKVRLLTRVAGPETEEAWLTLAATLRASDLAREVRRVDAGSLEGGGLRGRDDDPDAWPRETVRIRCAPHVRAKWWRARQLANRVAGEALRPSACAEAIAAEVLSAIPVDLPDAHPPLRLGGTYPPPAPSTQRASRHRRADLCGRSQGEANLSESQSDGPRFLLALVEGLADADSFELDARLRRAVALEQQLEARLGPLLRRVADGRVHRSLGFATLSHYLCEQLGMSLRRAQALLRLERAGDRCPELLAAYRAGRISWVRAHALVPVLLLVEALEDPAVGLVLARRWVKWAQVVTVRRLEEDVERALVLHDVSPDAWRETGGLPAEARDGGPRASEDRPAATRPNAQIGAKPMRPEETAQLFFTATMDVSRLVRAVICTVRRRVECETGRFVTEGEAFEAMLDHVFDVWSLDADGRRRVKREHRVFARDGWRCTVPGCTSYRNLHDHHIVYRSVGGAHELSNRTTLGARVSAPTWRTSARGCRSGDRRPPWPAAPRREGAGRARSPRSRRPA
jgi:5-methylcytosine-specific restriction endonuclease McrA